MLDRIRGPAALLVAVWIASMCSSGPVAGEEEETSDAARIAALYEASPGPTGAALVSHFPVPMIYADREAEVTSRRTPFFSSSRLSHKRTNRGSPSRAPRKRG